MSCHLSNIAELRDDCPRIYFELYNSPWLVEKNGFPVPRQARQAVAQPPSQSGSPHEQTWSQGTG